MSEYITARVHAAVINGHAIRNAVVRYPSVQPSIIRPTVEPFTSETHSTVDINGIIIIAPAGFILPASLTMTPDFSHPGAFDNYLSNLARTVPTVTDGQQAQTIVLHF